MATTKRESVAAEERSAAKAKAMEKNTNQDALDARRDAETPEVSHVPAKDLTGTGLEAVTENPVDALESENVVESQKHGKEATDRAVKSAEGDRSRTVDADPPVDVTPRPDLGEFQSGVKGCLQAVYVYLTANDIFSRQQALNELHQAMKKGGIKLPVPVDPTKPDA